jgi:hypothetical protein
MLGVPKFLSNTQTGDRTRRLEAAEINKSLLALKVRDLIKPTTPPTENVAQASLIPVHNSPSLSSPNTCTQIYVHTHSM